MPGSRPANRTDGRRARVLCRCARGCGCLAAALELVLDFRGAGVCVVVTGDDCVGFGFGFRFGFLFSFTVFLAVAGDFIALLGFLVDWPTGVGRSDVGGGPMPCRRRGCLNDTGSDRSASASTSTCAGRCPLLIRSLKHRLHRRSPAFCCVLFSGRLQVPSLRPHVLTLFGTAVGVSSMDVRSVSATGVAPTASCCRVSFGSSGWDAWVGTVHCVAPDGLWW